MAIDIPDVTEGGSDPSPVEWANDHVKPAILELDGRAPVVYANLAALDAVTQTEFGVVRVREFDDFGLGGPFQNYSGSDAYVTTLMGNDYNGPGSGSDWPDEATTGYGGLYQEVLVTDGYIAYKLYRWRSHNGNTNVWGTWTAWKMVAMPGPQPSTKGLWQGGPATNDQRWVPLLDVPSDEQSVNNYGAPVSSNAAIFNALDHASLEGGRLLIKSAGFEFNGILDGARTVVGTETWVGRAGTTIGRTGRVDYEAAAAATDAVAGFHYPLPIVGYMGGIGFDMTVAPSGGLSTNTRLLFGICETAYVSSVMADVDPSTLDTSKFIGLGYDDDSVVTQYGGGAAVPTTANPTTTTNQKLNLRMRGSNGSGSVIPYVSLPNNTYAVQNAMRTFGFAYDAPMSIFLRISAGGTSAQPKVGLLKLVFGHLPGLRSGSGGGW